MIAELKPYPAMKDSGIEWLGQVPEHWSVAPLCSIAKTKSITDQQDRELLSVYLDLGVIRFSDVKEKRTNVTSEDLSKYQAVDPGDFVLNNQQAWRGSVGVSKHAGIVSPAYLVLSLGSGITPEFANLLFRERTMVAQYLIASKGVGSIQRNLYWPHLKRVSTFVPPLPEQAAIVRYVDHVDRRLRRFVRAKRRLIALLTEQNQAIIHRAVTRGLDPDVPLKDSGVEWPGEVPEHWEVRRLKTLFREIDVRTTTGEETLLSLRMYEGLVPHEKVSAKPISAGELVGYKKVKPGQLVMNRMRAAIGIFGVPNQAGLVSPDYAIFEPAAALNLAYFLRLLKSSAMCAEFRIASKGLGTGSSGFMRLYTDQFGTVWAPFPPPAEQAVIAKHLDHANADVETAISRAQREISLLGEYRTRMIADVVTGKLDVREAAAALPDVDPLDTENDLDDEQNGDTEANLDDLDAIPEEAEA